MTGIDVGIAMPPVAPPIGIGAASVAGADRAPPGSRIGIDATRGALAMSAPAYDGADALA